MESGVDSWDFEWDLKMRERMRDRLGTKRVPNCLC